MTARSVFARAGSLRLHLLIWGEAEAPPLVLVHGAGAHAHWWDGLLPHLVPRWRVIAPDLRGHGESDWAVPARYRIEDFASDLVQCLTELGAGTVAIAGHSMGGRVSAWVAAHHPERVRALALLDTRMRGLETERVEKWRGATGEPRPQSTYPDRERALGAFRLTPDEPDVATAVREKLARHAVVERAPGQWSLRFDRAVLALEGSRLAALVGLLGEVRCPSILMRGASSTVVGESQSAEMARALGGCEERVFPGGHHFLLAHPDAVGDALVGFLDRI